MDRVLLALLGAFYSLNAAAAGGGKTASPKFRPQKIETCKSALKELGGIFKKVPEQSKFQLPGEWSEGSHIEYDFDGDKQMDKAAVLVREFEPVFADAQALKEALTGPDEPFGPDKRAPSFLVVWLSNNGKPKMVLPKGGSFSEATSTFIVDVDLKMMKTGSGVIESNESTMMSMGGWSATSFKKKWRFENGDFRLIGRTENTFQRNTGESEETDENLLTGQSIVKTQKLADAGDDSEDAKMISTTKTVKGKPSKIFLGSEGKCDDEPVTMNKVD
jgi:hypothetical protein